MQHGASLTYDLNRVTAVSQKLECVCTCLVGCMHVCVLYCERVCSRVCACGGV